MALHSNGVWGQMGNVAIGQAKITQIQLMMSTFLAETAMRISSGTSAISRQISIVPLSSIISAMSTFSPKNSPHTTYLRAYVLISRA
jgi:hypothetical protein